MFLGLGAKVAEPLGSIPYTSNLLWYHDAFYVTESGGQVSELPDQSGNGRHITVSGGRMGSGIQQAEMAVGDRDNTKPRKYIYNTSDSTGGMRWNGSGWWPGSSYTLMHIISYTPSGQRGRIFDGFGLNYLSGTHGGVGTGVYYHNNWVIVSNAGYNDHFFISLDRLNNVRCKGKKSSDGSVYDSGYTSGAGNSAPSVSAGIGVNCGDQSGDLNTSGLGEVGRYNLMMAACYSGDIGNSNCNTLMNWAYDAIYG